MKADGPHNIDIARALIRVYVLASAVSRHETVLSSPTEMGELVPDVQMACISFW